MSYKTDLQGNNTELEEILETVQDLPDAVQRSPFPIEVSTASKMDAILKKATKVDVGATYKYVGETTGTYRNGELYIIAEETE